MAVIIPTGFAQMVVHWTRTGDPDHMLNVWGVEVTGGAADPSVLAQQFYTSMVIHIVPIEYDPNLQLSKVVCSLGNATGDYPIGEYAATQIGTRTEHAASPQVAALVRKNTALGGRRHRGRCYLPAGFMAGGDVLETGQLLGARQTALQTMMNFFKADIFGSADLGQLVLLHSTATKWELNPAGQPRRVPDPDAPAPPAPTVITSLSVESQVATQRRRLRN